MEDVEIVNRWEWLTRQMERRGLAAVDLAARAGVGLWRVKLWIDKIPGHFHPAHVEPLARVLGVSVAEIEAEVAKVRA